MRLRAACRLSYIVVQVREWLRVNKRFACSLLFMCGTSWNANNVLHRVCYVHPKPGSSTATLGSVKWRSAHRRYGPTAAACGLRLARTLSPSLSLLCLHSRSGPSIEPPSPTQNHVEHKHTPRLPLLGIYPPSVLGVPGSRSLTPALPTNARFASARQGLSLGPLIDLVLRVDPSILVTALLATTTVFVCFAGTALFAKRRSYLYLGGVLSSGLMGEKRGGLIFSCRCFRFSCDHRCPYAVCVVVGQKAVWAWRCPFFLFRPRA